MVVYFHFCPLIMQVLLLLEMDNDCDANCPTERTEKYLFKSWRFNQIRVPLSFSVVSLSPSSIPKQTAWKGLIKNCSDRIWCNGPFYHSHITELWEIFLSQKMVRVTQKKRTSMISLSGFFDIFYLFWRARNFSAIKKPQVLKFDMTRVLPESDQKTSIFKLPFIKLFWVKNI